jgi:light-regulated signal transduction histidine kinase (bacteriophytochrome)
LVSARQEHVEAVDVGSVLDAAADLILGVSRGGVCDYASAAAVRVLGAAPATLVGVRFEDLVHVDDHAALAAAGTAIAVHGEARLNLRLLRTRGPWLDADVTIRRGPAGHDTLVVRPSRDEEVLLRRRVADLERSNDDLEQFAYVASHDLQEPLRIVRMCVELFARRYEGQLDGDADEYILHARSGAERMSVLISDLLTYSRVGTRDVQAEPVDLFAVAQEVLATVAPLLDEAGATVEVGPLPTVSADPVQINQLLQNLISNAVKFQRPGAQPRVVVRSERDADGWRVTVSDNGIGIPPSQATAVFAMFKRLHGRDQYPGTGIGLAVCRKIVERRGGRIWAGPVLGGGTTFTFTLPDQWAEQ